MTKLLKCPWLRVWHLSIFVVFGSFYPFNFSLSFLSLGLVGCLSFLPLAFVPNCIPLSISPVELAVSSFLSSSIFFSLLFRFEHNQPQESHFFLYCACCIFCFWYDSLFIFILFFGLIFFGLIFGTNYSNNDNAKGQDGVEE